MPILDQSEKVIFWIENNIMFCRFNQIDCHLSVKNAEYYLSQIEKISQGKHLPLIIDIRKFKGTFAPHAAKIFSESAILKNITLHAFVADTLNAKLLIASYNRLYLKAMQVHICKSMEEARALCNQFKMTSDAGSN